MNSIRPCREPSGKVSSESGFAIVMALSLLSLVFLLVISLVNLVGIDLTLGDARKKKVLAQAHARMGMMVAIGELQKHLGPDTRVSATADLLDERIEHSSNYEDKAYTEEASLDISSGVPLNQAIDLNENGQMDVVPFGQRYWTGVWKHRARRKGASDEHRAGKPLPKNLETSDSISSMALTDSEYDPHPAIEVAWLVSGNEGWTRKLVHQQGNLVQEYVEIPDGIEMDQRAFLKGGIYGQNPNAWEDYRQSLSGLLTNYDHPLNALPDPDETEDTVWMLKAPLLGANYNENEPESWKNHLKGEPIKVRKTRIKPLDSNTEPLSEHGAYAYWVGDEGVKTKINICTPLKDSNGNEDGEVKLNVALEPNIAGGSFGLQFDSSGQNAFHSAKHHSLSLLKKDEALNGEENFKTDKIAAHFHSLTPFSHGLLTDTRTGGLKRDLSHAFANSDDWDESLEQSTYNWVNDFIGYIYKDRVHYLKSVPMGPNAKANQWNDTAATESVNDYNAILAGPLWRTLGSFHNLYTKIVTSQTSTEPAIANQEADRLPRVTGDNYVLFNSSDGQPPSSNNPFWNEMNMPKNTAITSRLNYFRTLDKKPGPRNHPIQPVLLEVKYSQIPTISDNGFLCLAMYPSVAFWNPYNVALDMDQLFIEVPMHQVYVNAFNPKDFDRWRKWFFYAFNPDPPQGGGGPGMRPPPFPPGFPTNGLRGPMGFSGMAGPAGGLFKSHFFQATGRDDPYIGTDQIESFFSNLPNGPSHYRRRGGTTNFELQYQFGKFMVMESNKPVNPQTNQLNQSRERHLLLKIENLSLRSGEKAHFTVADKQIWNWQPRPTNNIRQFVQVNLAKGVDRYPFICQTPLFVSDNEPLLVECGMGRIEGIHPSQMAFYNINNASRAPKHQSASNLPNPKGITIYSETPIGKTIENRKPIYKNSKTFDVGSGWNIWHYLTNSKARLSETSDPAMHGQETLPGIGFRIRYKLPGNADKVVLEQFNLRALVHSYQDGFGDNWREEKFVGSRYRSFRPELYSRINSLPTYNYSLPSLNQNGEEISTNYRFTPSSCKFFDFYDLNPEIKIGDNFDDVLTPLSSPRMHGVTSSGFSPFNLDQQIVPKITSDSSSIGFFHDTDEEHGDQMMVEESASLFEIPSAPMLSILQLRHANLNDYSHSPSYVLGNSYANPQVGRYKTWGRVRAISWKPLSSVFDIGNNWQASDLFLEAYSIAGYNRSPWQVFISENNLHMPEGANNYGTVRNVDAQSEHQNTTVDHSYYINRALLDGYFMSGIGRGEWQGKTTSQMLVDAADLFSDTSNLDLKYSPFRNSRLKPYWEKSALRMTSYGDKSNEVTSSSDDEFRYQTLAADLLVEGSFNINSTSVSAWVSQLSSLRGLAPPNFTPKSEETPFPRFTNFPSKNSWNQIASLNDDEIKLLAHCLVEQIKLRGPFLSYADFVNRRIQGVTSNRLDSPFAEWNSQFPENRDSVLGFRGALQAAIAEAEINQAQFQKQSPSGGNFAGNKGEWPNNPMIPFIPTTRYTGGPINTFFRLPSSMGYLNSEFGLHAVSTQPFLHPEYIYHTWANFNPQYENSYARTEAEYGVGKRFEENYFAGTDANGNKLPANFNWTPTFSFKAGWDDYSSAFEFGEAPENLLAIENVATAANKPGWLMQSDVLSPLAPVSNARSDTFTIRVMGEPKAVRSKKINSRAWLEITVQRIPDYIKPELDAPHHRPHEPFEDRNFNGYWDNDPSFVEHWLDLNQNGMDDLGETTLPGAVPDLPGVGKTNEKNWFADGLYSDLKMNPDLEEESADSKFSRMGINQRFGRKFRIINFRWIKEQDV